MYGFNQSNEHASCLGSFVLNSIILGLRNILQIAVKEQIGLNLAEGTFCNE